MPLLRDTALAVPPPPPAPTPPGVTPPGVLELAAMPGQRGSDALLTIEHATSPEVQP